MFSRIEGGDADKLSNSEVELLVYGDLSANVLLTKPDGLLFHSDQPGGGVIDDRKK